jgi:glycine hydroxymethyltransferase
MVSSGVRIGTPALATRGLGVPEFQQLGELIREALAGDFEAERERLARECAEIAARYPLYPGLSYRQPAPAGA